MATVDLVGWLLPCRGRPAPPAAPATRRSRHGSCKRRSRSPPSTAGPPSPSMASPARPAWGSRPFSRWITKDTFLADRINRWTARSERLTPALPRRPGRAGREPAAPLPRSSRLGDLGASLNQLRRDGADWRLLVADESDVLPVVGEPACHNRLTAGPRPDHDDHWRAHCEPPGQQNVMIRRSQGRGGSGPHRRLVTHWPPWPP